MAMQKLITEHLVLRKYVEEDAKVLYELLGRNPKVTKYTGWNPYATMEMAENTVKDFISQYGKEHFYGWAIEADGVLVGTIGAYDYDPVNRSIEIGYSIGSPYWRKGYATEAVQWICYYLKHYENIEQIHAWCAKENIASICVLEKAGMHLNSMQELLLDDVVHTKLNFVL